MTNADLIIYYKNLLIIQYKTKEKAPEHIAALIDAIMIFELIENVQNAYSIAAAVGVQLDVLGKYLGFTRAASTGTTTVNLNDADFRFFLQFKIIQNNSNSSLSEIDDLMFQFFGATVDLYDNLDMSIEYTLLGVTLQTALILVNENLLPKPAAVGINVILASADPFVFFDDPDGFGFGELLELDAEFTDASLIEFTDTTQVEFVDNTADPAESGGEFSGIIL